MDSQGNLDMRFARLATHAANVRAAIARTGARVVEHQPDGMTLSVEIPECGHCHDTGHASGDPLDPNACGFCRRFPGWQIPTVAVTDDAMVTITRADGTVVVVDTVTQRGWLDIIYKNCLTDPVPSR